MKTQRHKVTFLNERDIETVVQAQLGRSTSYIQKETGLTPCQIQYRLTKAKKIEGLARGVGYRTAWRTGKSPLARLVDRLVLPKLRARVSVELPKRFLVVFPHKDVVHFRKAA